MERRDHFKKKRIKGGQANDAAAAKKLNNYCRSYDFKLFHISVNHLHTSSIL